MSFSQLNFVVGDIKSVVFQNVTTASNAVVSSATYTVTNHVTGAVVTTASTATVVGATITTPNITWATQGQFLVLLAVTFADGTVDHSTASYVNVGPVPV